MNFNLINEQKSSLEEVVTHLDQQKAGTAWATKTNDLATNYAKHLGEVYGDSWYKGLLPKELFLEIVLPNHGHYEDKHLFPDNTPVSEVLAYYRNAPLDYTKDCLDLIQYLKQEILSNGFTSTLVLVVIDNKLKHVDGFHRLVALSLLLNEGYEYQPIPAFLCRK